MRQPQIGAMRFHQADKKKGAEAPFFFHGLTHLHVRLHDVLVDQHLQVRVGAVLVDVELLALLGDAAGL